MTLTKLLLGGAAAAALLTVPAVFAQDATPQTAETAAEMTEAERLNAWFEEVFEENVARAPMTQTFLGRRTNYDQWNDASPEFREETYRMNQARLTEMRESFDRDALDESAALSWRLFEYDAEQAEAMWRWRDHGFVFNQMGGPHSGIPAFLINQHRIDTEAHAIAYIGRLRNAAAYLDQNRENAEQRFEMGVAPPAWTYPLMIETARNVISGAPFEEGDDSPILADFRAKVTALGLEEDETARLVAQAQEALTGVLGPAYERVIAMFEDQAERADTDDGVWRLPEGEAYYNAQLARYTTTEMTASEIHDLGLEQVARIHDEMRGIMEEVEFEGSLQEFFEFMRTDPQFYYPNTDEGRDAYLAKATRMIDEMREALPAMFHTFPQADMVVRRVEPFREASAGKAFYQRPAPDGSRPGIYYANLRDMADMPIYQMEALAYHEGIPGHHMQLAIMQELEGVPSFRRFGGYTAYTEGWGLYTEYFPVEFGFYADPYSNFGRLAMELWRAARLVVDTGLHHHQWTREEAIDYLIENTPNSEGDATNAIERYIVMPGQATAYMIGMLEILRLRGEAEAALGDAYDIRDFHDVVLTQGATPLSVFEERVNAWIEEMLAEQG